MNAECEAKKINKIAVNGSGKIIHSQDIDSVLSKKLESKVFFEKY